MKLTTLAAVLFSLTAVSANAQDTEPPATPPAQEKPNTPATPKETPPDLKAYQDASKITDPEKR